MIENKVRLTIVVPGATTFSKQLCFKNSKNGEEVPVENMTETFTVKSTEFDKESKKHITKFTSLHICKRKPTHQILNMSREAYNYMTDSKDCPSWFKPQDVRFPAKVWHQMSNDQRLLLHLERIAESLGGTLESYFVAED